MDWQVEVVLALRDARQGWLDLVMWVPHALGSAVFYTLMLPILYLALGRPRGLQLVAVMVVSFALIEALKEHLGLPRPYVVLGFESIYGHEGAERATPAFPSGHALGTASFWTSLAIIVRRRWTVWCAVLVPPAVAFSRVYAGVHWPIDVLAGLGLGYGVTGLGFWWFRRPRVAQSPYHALWVVGPALAAVSLLVLVSAHAIPYVGLAAGLLGAQRAAPRSPASPGWEFWGLLVLPTLVIIGAVTGSSAVLLGDHPWGQALAYLFVGMWLTLAAHQVPRWLGARA